MTSIVSSVLVCVTLLITACGPNQRIINSAQENPVGASNGASDVAPAANSFERDLNAMRNADFNFIYVFRRRDGGVLDSDDKGFVTSTSPPEMNRRTLSDEGKALLIGSNFRMPEEILDKFRARFVFEDYSKPGAEPPRPER